MTSSKRTNESSGKRIFVKFNLIYIVFLFVGFIGYSIYLLIQYIKQKVENYDSYYTCTMTLNDIDPMNVNQYMKYDNKQVPCGDCMNGTLKVVVNPCADDENGVQMQNCKPNVNIVSSNKKPIHYSESDVSFDKLDRFFCLK